MARSQACPWVDEDIWEGSLAIPEGSEHANARAYANQWQSHRDLTRIARALEHLVEFFERPVPPPDDGQFLDQVARRHIELAMGPDPGELLRSLMSVSHELGRVNNENAELRERLEAKPP